MHADEKWYLKGRKGDAKNLAGQIGVSGRLASMLILKLQQYCPSQSDFIDCGELGDHFANAGVYRPGRQMRSLDEAAREFLQPDLNLLYDGMLMKDMDKAVAVLKDAAQSNKKTLIIGDYDVDGIMGVLILHRMLGKVLHSVTHCIPHRVDDGYGINEKIVRAAHADGVRLIVTCDNGMSAHETIKLAKNLGIRVIISDHHDVPEEEAGADAEGYGAPPADAVVNPKQPECPYPFKDLCGAMVAYKLAWALMAEMGVEIADDERGELLCYASIATICDIVSLVDENRRIVYHGLKLLNAGVANPGMSELINVCGLTGKTLTTYEVGHIIGPCINAAGRLDTAELSYDLFTERDPLKIAGIASEMLDLNRKRQDLTARAYDEAVGVIEREGASCENIIVLNMPETHESICGIVAGKLKDKYARPVIVLTGTVSGLLKGSGRSVEGCDLLACIKSAGGLLAKYGGHKMAVGISVESENLERLRIVLNQNCNIKDELLVPKEMVDLCLTPDDVTMDLIGDISRLEPFGRGNERPVFALKGMPVDSASLIGSKRNVIKMKLRNNICRQKERRPYAGSSIEAVFFGDVKLFMQKLDLKAGADGAIVLRGSPAIDVDLTFFPEINEYNGVRRVQLIIRSVRKAY